MPLANRGRSNSDRDSTEEEAHMKATQGSRLLLERLIEAHGPEDRADLYVIVDGVCHSTERRFFLPRRR
jgi:hypothetical protein